MPLADERYEQEFWDLLLYREQSSRLWEAIDRLPEDERDTLLRWADRYREGQRVPERIQRIIEKLRAWLGVTAES